MKSKSFFLFFLLLQVFSKGISQQISNAEYFIDTDPGLGNGTSISVVNPGDTIDQLNTIPLAGLQAGGHLLYMRTRDASGNWSMHESRAFTVAPAAPANSQLVAAECFFDTDPGLGNGTALAIATPGDSIDVMLAIPVTGLSPGGHILYLRTRDNGHWSLHESRSIFVLSIPANRQIVAAEYFFDTDPGAGNGTPYSIGTPSDSIDITMTITAPALSLGNHLLYVRTKDVAGNWSLHEPRNMYICSTYGADANFAFDVIGNTAFFHDSSAYVTSHKWVFGDGQQDTVKVNPAHAYATGGSFNVCLMTYNACGNDTLCTTVNIDGIQTIQPASSGQTGLFSVRITGYGFEPGSEIKLVKAGQSDIVAENTIFINTRELKVVFRLQNAPLGMWSVAVDNPVNSDDTLSSVFEIQLARTFDPWVKVLNPRKMLVNTSIPIRIAYGNKGNTTVFAVPVYIRVSGNRTPLLLTGIDNSPIPQAMLDTMLSFPTTHFFMQRDTIRGDSSMMAAILIPYVEPGVTKYIDITVHSTLLGNFFVEAKVLQPLFTPDQLDSLGLETNCNFLPNCWQCLLDLAGLAPQVGCVTAGFSLGCAIGGAVNGTGQQTAWDVLQNLGGTILSCTTPIPEAAAAQAAGDLLNNSLGGEEAFGSCLALNGGCNPFNINDWTQFPTAASMDPNIKEGPKGINAQNYISGRDASHYRISFENAPAATAPAREVVLVDTLDTSRFDLNSFFFTQFGFGDSLYSLETNRESFTTEIDLRPSKNVILRVRGHLDHNSGVVTCKFSSFDPLTMALTDSINEGFLPPNITRPEGEGFVSFSIRPRSNLVHLQTINNTAYIYFDANAPIVTPTWLNTIDIVKPQSAVSALPVAVANPSFPVNWGGSDAHAGIMDYSIYVSDNNAPYRMWYYGVKFTSATFHGVQGHSYKFFSVSRDYAMNVEDTPAVADAQTSIITDIQTIGAQGDLWMTQNVPNPFSENSLVEIHLPAAMKIRITISDILGKEVKTIFDGKLPAGHHTQEFNADKLAQGIYFLTLSTPKKRITQKISIIKN